MDKIRFLGISCLFVAVFLMNTTLTTAQTLDEIQLQIDAVQEQADDFYYENNYEEVPNTDENSDSYTTYNDALTAYENNSAENERFFDLFSKLFVGGTVIGFIILLFALLIGLAAFIFNIVMIIDCAKREIDNKALWLLALIIGLLLGWGWIVAIIYLVVTKNGTSSEAKSESLKSNEPSKAKPESVKSNQSNTPTAS